MPSRFVETTDIAFESTQSLYNTTLAAVASAFKTFQDARQHNETDVYVNALIMAASVHVRSMWDWL